MRTSTSYNTTMWCAAYATTPWDPHASAFTTRFTPTPTYSTDTSIPPTPLPLVLASSAGPVILVGGLIRTKLTMGPAQGQGMAWPMKQGH